MAMPPPTYPRLHAEFYTRLEAAREKAEEEDDYDSAAIRAQLTDEFKKRCEGKLPRDWQLDVTEALMLGLNGIVIAGTGYGKTMPFVMPAFVSNKIILIMSPLNALERDQVRLPDSLALSESAE